MLFEDTYLTIKEPSQGLYKDRGSKFSGFAFPVKTEEDVKKFLAGMTMPAAAAASTPQPIATAKSRPATCANKVAKAPTVIMSPCAKLVMRSTLKTSDRPTAITA